MGNMAGEKIKSLVQLYELLPDEERIMVDMLRQLILSVLPSYCKEKISLGVPYFYGKKGIYCLVATVPRGGIRKGVLFGLWYGKPLKDPWQLPHPRHQQTNLYKIFSPRRNTTPENYQTAQRSGETGYEWWWVSGAAFCRYDNSQLQNKPVEK